jgi:hypothetical protein
VENWNGGKMECWKNGMLGDWGKWVIIGLMGKWGSGFGAVQS